MSFRGARQPFWSQVGVAPYPIVDNNGVLNFVPPVPSRLVSIWLQLVTDATANSPRTVQGLIFGRQEAWDPNLPPGPPTGLGSTLAWQGTIAATPNANQDIIISAFPGADGSAASGISIPDLVVAPWGLVQVSYTNLDTDDQLTAVASWEPV